MSALSGLRIAIAGAGVFGLAIAARAARAGAQVTVFDPRELGDNASGVAAGMLAPALEAVLEQAHPGDYGLLRRAYAAWPGFAADLGLAAPADLAAGALYVGSVEEVQDLRERLAALGVLAERLSFAEARRRQPGLGGAGPEALYVDQDGRLDPSFTLRALQQVVVSHGGGVLRAPLTPRTAAGYEAVILAAGFESRAWRDRVADLAWLQPIKGHVLHYHGGVTSGPVVRSRTGYAAPQYGGTVFGATMEAGRSDLELDPGLVERLHREASALFPSLAHKRFTPLTGVRASTPDGRPMVGRTASGLYVATAARRNGWLLAPLVAEAMVQALQGSGGDAAFDPTRFGPVSAFTNA